MLLYSNPAPLITTSKMCLFLLVIFSLIGASAGEMSPAPTPEFRRCFPQWVNASQVQVSCNNTLIAQLCDPDQSCRNMNNTGVSLEKDREGVCLNITNCSYDARSCKAQSYIDSEQSEENFTVNMTCNHESHSESIAVGITVSVIIIIIIIIIIVIIIIVLIICYKKVTCFRTAIRDFCHRQCINRTPTEKQDNESEESFLE
ncbi:uncharacterized protein LOC113081318 [Carassius auratus]|uniref:Uncharacterized protein LOC113081318 n=1 Tax=Carassius auratus TaxID=7957 RepID=A0A6P6NJN1_CARAU|nr:uncharacterized protein LOC113081318 [Carassius auratus]